MTLGEKIKKAREDKGLSQIRLAVETDIGVASIQRYERDELSPSVDKLIQISEALKVPIGSLITIEPVDNNIKKGIVLKDLNLQEIRPSDEFLKVQEENKEFEMAVLECLCNPIEENKLHAIEEFWDKVQSSLSYLQITLGITANEVMEQYHLHLEKIKNRPR